MLLVYTEAHNQSFQHKTFVYQTIHRNASQILLYPQMSDFSQEIYGISTPSQINQQ